MAIIVFPEALREKIGDGEGKYPHVCFSPMTKNLEYEKVHLYCPQGISVSDGANYNGVELGAVRAGQSFADQVKGDSKFAMSDNQQFVGSLKLLDKMGVDASVTAAQAIDRGVAFNPQTALAFESMNLRTFDFKFTLVPESKKDSNLIRDIEDFFRKYMYPEVENFVAKYPEKFRIQFFDGEEENPYMPFIYDCFLAGMSVEVNAEGNSFHKADDGFGAPTSVSMTLQFSEARMLSRQDIYKNKQGFDYNYDRPATMAGGSTQTGGDG